jgi:hypothetical protein
MPALADENGRSGGIRTHDPLSPRQVRYQAALRSDRFKSASGRTEASADKSARL